MPTSLNSTINTPKRISVFGLLASVALAAQTISFEPHTLAADLTGGYQVVVADLNNDGKPDLIALASGMSELVWYENPTWQRHVIATGLNHMINVAAFDFDGDGIPEIALASGFSNNAAQSVGKVAVLHHHGDPRQPWDMKEIDQLPTSHRLRWANIDGSGHKVLVNAPLTAADAQPPDYRGHVPLVYYEPGNWRRRTISDSEEGIVHGIFITDWDRSGRDAILIGGFLGIHLYRYGADRQWTREEIAKGNPAPWPKGGTSDIAVGQLNHRERFLATIEPWHGNEVVVYRQAGQDWKREVIDNTLLDAHTILTADFDKDGSDEIVAGFRGKPYGVYIYKFDGHQWNRQTLDLGDMSAAACAIADLDADGLPDIACIGSATHNLKWYRNLSQPAAAVRVPTQDGLTYGSADGQPLTMDYYAPKGPAPHPIAIIIHGGGYQRGNSKSGSEAYCADFLAPAGYAVFSINYRLAPKYPYPYMVYDVERAIRYLRYHAAEWNANPKQIVLVGGSAGGFLSNMVGLLNLGGNPKATDPVDRQSARVQAVVTLFAQSSFATVPLNNDVHALLDPLIAQKGEPEALREASPITYVKRGDPPFLLIQGDQDEYIPLTEATNLQTALHNAGVRCDIIRIPGGHHGTGAWHTLPNVPDWERQMVEWLDARLNHQGAIGEGIRPR